MGRKLSVMASTCFSCVMISCPMISEVFIYYLHNGIGLSYCLSALMMMSFTEAFEKEGKARLKKLGITLCILWLTNGSVETFTIVFLMAIVMIWVLQSIYKVRKIPPRVVAVEGLTAGVLLAVSIVLRTVSAEVLTVLFSLQDQRSVVSRRSILMALDWFKSEQGLGWCAIARLFRCLVQLQCR